MSYGTIKFDEYRHGDWNKSQERYEDGSGTHSCDSDGCDFWYDDEEGED